MGVVEDGAAVGGDEGHLHSGKADRCGRIRGAVGADLSSGEVDEWGRVVGGELRWEDVWVGRQVDGDDHACRIHAMLHR